MVELEGNGSAGPNGSAEGNGTAGGNGFSEVLPPPPSEIPPDVKPLKVEPPKKKRVPMARKGLGTKGNRIQLLSNHFKVNIGSVDGQFFHYYVNICYEDGHAMDAKGMGRKVIDQVKKTYASDLGGKNFAYDGEKSLFTVGALPRNKLEFDVVLEDVQSARNPGNSSPGNDDADRKRVKRPHRTKSYKVELSYAAKIPMQAIANAIRGQENENTQEALRVLDIILRQHAAKQGCLLVRQSFFHHDAKNYTDVGGGVQGCRGFHTSFRGTQAGLSLNIDVSTTMTVQPGPVVDFLITNQNVRDPSQIDWSKAKRVLKNLRVKATTSNQEYKISGLSDRPCRDQTFTLKRKGDDEETEITVYDYFVNHRKIDLRYSANMPCINVGKPKRPTFIPIELCELVSLQRYTKSLTNLQRAALVEKSRQKPLERMNALNNALRISNYNSDPMLRECGVSIGKDFLQFDGRVLPTPKLKAGNGEDFFPRNGRWNFNNKRLVEPCKVERWAVVNFSARCDPKMIVSGLMKAGQAKGVKIEDPFDIFEENHQVRRAPPVVRVEKMCEQLQAKLPGMPLFLLCLLPERKNCDVYGPWKKKNLAEFGVVTQCMAPFKVNDQYLTNVLLKINAKLGGLNSLLSIERSPTMIVSKVPTIILGMDVSHGSPGHSDVPSIAAVVSSRGWPLISRYRACVRTQSPKVEMIDNLFKPNGAEDEGIIREALIDFYNSSGKRKPEQIIIFRDGVSESQFNQVLNIELDQIIEACKFLDESWNPKFVVIIAQKNHHTKFFQSGGCPDNVPPGTIIDNTVCHPRNYDFYLCAHAGMIGTTRPTHYHVLYDEVGFAADELQELVHSLSYVYQRSTTAISVVAPVCYAHLAATQMSQWMKFEDNSETTSSHGGSGSGGMTSKGPAAVPQLPKLNELVSSSMFFC